MERTITENLNHVSWIGGSPCSGKSTIADTLAGQLGMTLYRCDDAYFRHAELVTADGQPTLHRLSRATCDELWLRPVVQQVSEEIALYDEEFAFILDDLSHLPADRPTLAEGAALMPHLLHELGVPPARATWIVPAPAFQRTQYACRDWRHAVLAECSDRDRAWENWMDRDAGFAQFVADDARKHGRTCITVDGSRPIAAILDIVRKQFALQGPRS